MDLFQAMKAFVRIVDTGSLTAAANSLDTSLPTVVRTLASLERHLGVSLLRRTTRRIHLTEEGTQYLKRCRDILSAMQEAEDVLVARRSHPKVCAEALFVDRVVNLVEEGVDVAVRIAHLKDSSLVAIPVGQVRRVICASEQYLRRHGVPQVPNDIRTHRCVRHVGLVPRSEWHFRVGNRQVSIPINSVITCNDIDSAVNACIDGQGLGMFLSYMVTPNRKNGQLRFVLETFETAPMPVQVVYSQSKLQTNTVRAFVNECVSKLRRARFD